MTTTKHTPAPWYQGRPYYTRANEMRVEVGPDDGTGQYIRRAATANSEANAARIVACVNSLEGIERPEAIKDALWLAFQSLLAVHLGDLPPSALEEPIEELRALLPKVRK